MMKAWMVALPGLVLCASPIAASELLVRVTEPRAFGYFIGDVLVRDVEIAAPAGQRIDPASVPRPGPLNYWLELRSARVDETARQGQTQYSMRLEYQTFYAPLEPRKLQIPSINLRVIKDEGESREAVIPAFEFLSSPLREIMPETTSDNRAAVLRPDVAVRRASTYSERVGMAVGGIAFLAGLILLVRHLAIWPFHRRKGRPFTHAMRTIRREAALESEGGDYGRSMLALHRAFDAAARQRIHAGDIDRFLDERPEFRPLRAGILSFFAQSQRAFFADDMMGARAELPLSELSALATVLSERERVGA